MTRTKTIESPYTFIYDKCYQFSSEVNYKKVMSKAMKAATSKLVVPIYKNMYSENKRYPNSTIITKHKNIIPPSYRHHYDLYTNDINNYLSRYVGMQCKPEDYLHLLPERFDHSVDPVGADRYRYMTTPLPSDVSNSLPPDIKLTARRIKEEYFRKVYEKKVPRTRNIGTQTMYRDGAVQTDPYTPDFLMRPGAKPEILSLIPFGYRDGLPPGLHEVQAFERSRRYKEAYEKYLKEISGCAHISHLKKMHKALKRQETREWEIREQQIDELQYARLKVIANLIMERRKCLLKMHDESIKRVVIELEKQKQTKLERMVYNNNKEMRKIIKRRLHITMHYTRPSKIEEYTNRMSTAWAPLARIGQFLDYGSERYVVESRYLNSYKGLDDLHQGLPSFVLNPSLKIPPINMYTADGFKKKKYRLEDELTELYQFLKRKKVGEAELTKKPLKFLQVIEHSVAKLPTPRMEFQNLELQDRDMLLTFLQQLLRGRAIQVMMFEDKEKRIDLIKELRSTHAVQDAEMELKIKEKEAIELLQRNSMNAIHQREKMEEIFNYVEGQSLGDVYDFLCKELIRLQEERRIHAFIIMAEKERRIREAEESGLRQLEQRRLREEEEIYKQIIGTHQITSGSYLEDVLTENMTKTAEDVATGTVEKLAIDINREAYQIEKERDYLKTEEIVSDLVHHFLIPEVYKKDAREQIALKQQKYLQVAHKEIVKTSDEVVKNQNGVSKNSQTNQ